MSSASGKRSPSRKTSHDRMKKPKMSAVFDMLELEKLIDLFQRKDITEFEVEQSGVRVKLGKHDGRGIQRISSSRTEPSTPPMPQARSHVDQTPSDPTLFPITAPLVGTFYRASAVDAKPFVEEGDEIRKGQILGLIEAMKLMNEIESDVDGTVVTILVENGTPVEYSEPLMLIRQR